MNKVIADMLAKIAGANDGDVEQEIHPPDRFRIATPQKRARVHRGYTKPVHNEKVARAKRLQAKASHKINRQK